MCSSSCNKCRTLCLYLSHPLHFITKSNEGITRWKLTPQDTPAISAGTANDTCNPVLHAGLCSVARSYGPACQLCVVSIPIPAAAIRTTTDLRAGPLAGMCGACPIRCLPAALPTAHAHRTASLQQALLQHGQRLRRSNQIPSSASSLRMSWHLTRDRLAAGQASQRLPSSALMKPYRHEASCPTGRHKTCDRDEHSSLR